MRYLVLIADGAILSGLILTLAIRLILRFLSPQASAPKAEVSNPNQPKTVDQLNIDIPL